MAFYDKIIQTISDTFQTVSGKTRDSVELTRLGAQERGVANELNALYAQIGRCYVDGEGGESMNDLCVRVKELREKLDALADQKAALRNRNRCPACGAAVEKSARFCPSCGRRMPEVEQPKAEDERDDASYCPDCGAMHTHGERFCAVCGHAYETENAEPAPEAAPKAESAPGVEIDNEAPNDFNAD